MVSFNGKLRETPSTEKKHNTYVHAIYTQDKRIGSLLFIALCLSLRRCFKYLPHLSPVTSILLRCHLKVCKLALHMLFAPQVEFAGMLRRNEIY